MQTRLLQVRGEKYVFCIVEDLFVIITFYMEEDANKVTSSKRREICILHCGGFVCYDHFLYGRRCKQGYFK